jgi:sugar phosphate isomerase/epimerase
MRVGVDTFTLRDLKLTPLQMLDYVAAQALEGALFGGLSSLSATRDPGELKAIRARADDLGLYTQVSLSFPVNPFLQSRPPDEMAAEIRREIEAAAACGWHELHASMGNGPERYEHTVPWERHCSETAAFLRRLGPILRAHGSRINLETHGDLTTFEAVRLVEEAGTDIAGICLDTANVLCHAEDPIWAAQRAAPYVHMTHLKDGALSFIPTGVRRQTLPPGRGQLRWRTILPILAEYAPDLPLSIEDHKWLFDFPVFERSWLRLHPDLTLEEMGRFMALAWEGTERIRNGTLPDPVAYDRQPHGEEVEERLRAGRDYLRGVLGELGLDRPGTAPQSS